MDLVLFSYNQRPTAQLQQARRLAPLRQATPIATAVIATIAFPKMKGLIPLLSPTQLPISLVLDTAYG